MISYKDFPPVNDLKKVLQFCPQAALLFINLPKFLRKSKIVRKNSIRKNFLISKTLFKNHCIALSKLELLSFEEGLDTFSVILNKKTDSNDEAT